MSIRLIIAAACLGLAAPSAALAQTQSPRAQPMSLGAIEQRLAADGFRVIEIERYADSIEVEGFDRAGVCLELNLDPHTGDVLRRERDDDCDGHERDHHDDRGDHSRHGDY